EASRGLYGSPRIHAALRAVGICCSRKRVARLMRQAGIHSQRVVRRRTRTTDSRHCRPVAPNLLARDFSASAPNQKWVGDILGICRCSARRSVRSGPPPWGTACAGTPHSL
ncbi:MAG: IS3 family transposase, partial [Rhodocyclaceae bacterium]|nr:IS3 family transposase [Rhodocyclaceae bacterium]